MIARATLLFCGLFSLSASIFCMDDQSMTVYHTHGEFFKDILKDIRQEFQGGPKAVASLTCDNVKKAQTFDDGLIVLKKYEQRIKFLDAVLFSGSALATESVLTKLITERNKYIAFGSVGVTAFLIFIHIHQKRSDAQLKKDCTEELYKKLETRTQLAD